MQKTMQKIRITTAFVLCLLFTACSTQKSAETKEIAESKEEPSKPKAQSTVSETVIDFPFPFGMEEGCKLTLACIDTEAALYELRFYDKYGTLAQQLSCGQLQEPIRFSYDDLANTGYVYDDLEIFSAGAKSGLLFVPAKTAIESGALFLEEAIEVPVYEELLGHRGEPCTFEETETQWEKILFHVEAQKKIIRPLRRMTLQKGSGLLEIWDYLDEQSICSDKAARKEDGSLANPEYYHYLFSENLYGIWDSSETDSAIPVWFSYTEDAKTPLAKDREKNPFEKIQETVFGNNGHMAEYKDRETFLSDFGFAEQEPFYCYYDSNGNLQLEFYLDEENGNGCGLIHEYHYTQDAGQLKKDAVLYGFAFDAVSEDTREPGDPYRLTNIYGETGKESVEEYEEKIDYREDGKVDAFQSLGIIDWLNEETEMPPDEKNPLVTINFIYRDDGSLFFRDYSHNSRVFSTTGQSYNSYYDELERPVYENAYITHGTLEYYYIYDDMGKEPKYKLCLDDNLGYYIPVCMRYH